ncbi:hypothetical protein, partial [Xanthomonas sacchari]|uniref:hypothetical protein n=1 Tax=Xanthomonas sacchari TaxID=56458 RepID=UPI002254F642
MRGNIFRFAKINLVFCFQFIDIFQIPGLESAQRFRNARGNGFGGRVENRVRRSPLLPAIALPALLLVAATVVAEPV